MSYMRKLLHSIHSYIIDSITLIKMNTFGMCRWSPDEIGGNSCSNVKVFNSGKSPLVHFHAVEQAREEQLMVFMPCSRAASEQLLTEHRKLVFQLIHSSSVTCVEVPAPPTFRLCDP